MRIPLVVRRWWAGPALLLLLALLPAPVSAQPGWYYLPELTLSETFDDNVFGASSRRESDFITRLSSGVKIGYRSRPLTFLLTSAFDAEAYAKHSDLDGLNRTETGFEGQWVALPRLTLRLNGAFTKTETPSELVSTLGLELGRQSSTDLSLAPSLSSRLRRTTILEAGYAYHHTEAGDVTSTTHEPRVRLSEQLTRVDLGTLAYVFRLIDSGGSRAESHVLLGGWARRLSARTGLILEAGPRLSDSGVNAEVNASLTHRWASWIDSTAGYSRSQQTIPTRAGPVDAQAVTASVSAVPLRPLTVGLNVTLSQVTQKPNDVLTEAAGLAVVYRLNRWLRAVGSYHFTHSESGGQATYHSLVSVGLQARYPTRLDD